MENNWHERLNIVVQGEEYKPMDKNIYNEKCFDGYDICDYIKPMEYAPYYLCYIFKNKDNKCLCVLQEDLTNVWYI